MTTVCKRSSTPRSGTQGEENITQPLNLELAPTSTSPLKKTWSKTCWPYEKCIVWRFVVYLKTKQKPALKMLAETMQNSDQIEND